MSNFVIKHQTQPTFNSCVSTCMAMILNWPAGHVIEKIDARYHSGTGLNTRGILNELGIPFLAFYGIDEVAAKDEGVYLCVVPSLNMEGNYHQLLIEKSSDDWTVLDPNKGREGKKYYVRQGEALEENEVHLAGYSAEAFIPYHFVKKNYHV